MVSWNRQKHMLIYEGILENDRMIPRIAGRLVRLSRARLIRARAGGRPTPKSRFAKRDIRYHPTSESSSFYQVQRLYQDMS